MSSFQGTAPSFCQKVPQKNTGEQRNITTECSSNKKFKKLPDHYNYVPADYHPPKITMSKATEKHQKQTELIMIKNG